MARRGVRGQSGRRSAGIPRVRPTQSRVRDALFNSLGPRVEGARILDLFAGSGARGGWGGGAGGGGGEGVAAVRELGTRRRVFDLILMDPPYGEGWIPR